MSLLLGTKKKRRPVAKVVSLIEMAFIEGLGCVPLGTTGHSKEIHFWYKLQVYKLQEYKLQDMGIACMLQSI